VTRSLDRSGRCKARWAAEVEVRAECVCDHLQWRDHPDRRL